MAAAQVVLTSIGYLLAYRAMGTSLGIGVIGAWGLCLAIGSLGTLADLGAADGLARSVAQRSAGQRQQDLRTTFVSGLLFCAVGCAVGGLVSYAVATLLLPRILMDTAALSTTLDLLAPALVVAGLTAIGGACQAVLEGLEQYRLRFAAGVAGTIVFVVAIFLLVPAFGLRGVVAAYLSQAVIVGSVAGGFCWWLTRSTRDDRSGALLSLAVVPELVRIGLPVRATGLMTMLLDPLTRVAVTYFGSIASAGHYEVAARLVLQLRTIIVAGFQAVLPRLVKLSATDPESAARMTAQTYRAGFSIAVAAFTGAVLVAPFIYAFVLGRISILDAQLFGILCAGWCVNAISAPYFFRLVAARQTRALWLSSATMAVTNVALFAPLGAAFGELGVVASLAVAIAAGSAVTVVAARRSDAASSPWLRLPELLLLGASAAAVVFVLVPVLRGGAALSAGSLAVVAVLTYGGVVLALMYFSGIFRR
jgi:O-antigen/teichoic acid export membrane protein